MKHMGFRCLMVQERNSLFEELKFAKEKLPAIDQSLIDDFVTRNVGIHKYEKNL
jgi:DNA-directed RNA polymerase subunit H (RpoH/RPB5)